MSSITSSVTRASVELVSHRVLPTGDAQLKRALTFAGEVTDIFLLCRGVVRSGLCGHVWLVVWFLVGVCWAPV